MPSMSSSLAFYDGYRQKRLPANLLQAQRDYFGAHTYDESISRAESSSIQIGRAEAVIRLHLHTLLVFLALVSEYGTAKTAQK